MLGNSDFTDDLYRFFGFFSAYSQDLIVLLIIRILEVKNTIFRNYGNSPVLRKIGFLTGLDLSKKFYTKQELRSMNNRTKSVD